MGSKAPHISVIIPSRNRRASLQRTLDSLCLQEYSVFCLEVLVVADGCIDDTVAMLRGYRAPFALRVIEQSGGGAGMARNTGAAHAKGHALLFLNDDVEPTPSWLGEHIRVHEEGKGEVVVAPFPPTYQGSGFLQLFSRAWWESRFQVICQPGHRFGYQDLHGGNFSIDSSLFTRIGGFDTDPALWPHEDYELGVRLIKAGAKFASASAALAYHHNNISLDRAVQKFRQEGKADVELARRHPDIVETLPFVCFKPFTGNAYPGRLLWTLLFASPAASEMMVAGLQKCLSLLERAKLRYKWRQLFKIIRWYWYWRGIIDALGSQRALAELVRENISYLTQENSTIELDLKSGLELAERRLDEKRPLAASIRYGHTPVGFIPHQPGAEALRGVHLRHFLSELLAGPLLEALAGEGGISEFDMTKRFELAHSISAHSLWFDPIPEGRILSESSKQWQALDKEGGVEQSKGMQRVQLNEAWREKTKLEEEWAHWQRLAEERGRTIDEQQASLYKLIRELS